MKVWILFIMAASLAPGAEDATGRWHGQRQSQDGTRREVTMALRIEGQRLKGDLETTNRRARSVDGTVDGTRLKGTADFLWDGKPQTLPWEADLSGDTMQLRLTMWPGGPLGRFDMKRISKDTTLPRAEAAPLPALTDLRDNGLARTPPMGWNSWNKFGCKVSDQLLREMTDAIVAKGLKDAGYVNINLDDCWQAGRDAQGNMQPDPQRFPNMKALADYIHSKGMKFGIYSSPGPKTCAGYDGSYGHEAADAKSYASWGVDYLKYDWCSASRLYDYEQMRGVFQKMGQALRATGRPIVYSLCQYGLQDVWNWGPKAGGHLWRTTGDIGPNWNSISEIGFEKQEPLAKYAGPGRWNDPDMLEVGNGDLTPDENRAHFSLWALLAAPLLAGNDVRSMDDATRAILTNRDVIAINQDKLGRQATRVKQNGTAEVWAKPLADGSVAVGLFNRGEQPTEVQITWQELSMKRAPKRGRDLWNASHAYTPGTPLTATVPRHGVSLWRLWP